MAANYGSTEPVTPAAEPLVVGGAPVAGEGRLRDVAAGKTFDARPSLLINADDNTPTPTPEGPPEGPEEKAPEEVGEEEPVMAPMMKVMPGAGNARRRRPLNPNSAHRRRTSRGASHHVAR